MLNILMYITLINKIIFELGYKILAGIDGSMNIKRKGLKGKKCTITSKADSVITKNIVERLLK